MAIKTAYIGNDKINSFQTGMYQKVRTGYLVAHSGERIRVTILRDQDGALTFDRRHDCKFYGHPAYEFAQEKWGAKSEAEAAKMYWDALDMAEFGYCTPAK
jgi:hypothetical protein